MQKFAQYVKVSHGKMSVRDSIFPLNYETLIWLPHNFAFGLEQI